MALLGDLLAVTSCTVGSEQTCTCCVEPGRLVPLDALELKRDSQREQVFSFAVLAVDRPIGKTLWVSTQEGLVWQVPCGRRKAAALGICFGLPRRRNCVIL